jgi:Na+-driven multidrug efflux pump
MAFAVPTLLIYSVGFFFDWMQNNMCGLIKAVNKQAVASIASLVAMVFISFPIAYTLGVSWGYGLSGLWTGYLVQNICLTVTYLVIMGRLDWDKTAE